MHRYMNEDVKDFQHIILTRFNLRLWNKDRAGDKVRTLAWLEHRFMLFERYCFPSVKKQTCQDFEWIVLFDSKTPDTFKQIIAGFQEQCPQLIPVFVEPEDGRYFAKIFRAEVAKRLCAKRVITTYLDNDDALSVRFVEDLQKRISSQEDDTFVYYDEGYQFYTDYKYMMQIHYPRNHFVSYVESGNPATLKSVFGFGGHYYIYTIKGAKIVHIDNLPMWCEVCHEKNMLNDAYFLLNAKMIHDEDRMRGEFFVDETVKYGIALYVFRFLPRYIRTFVRRAKRYLHDRKK
jgi:glycosyltransferase involved in cell wall biosynthesis